MPADRHAFLGQLAHVLQLREQAAGFADSDIPVLTALASLCAFGFSASGIAHIDVIPATARAGARANGGAGPKASARMARVKRESILIRGRFSDQHGFLITVIPAKAGIHFDLALLHWLSLQEQALQ